jgi:hypothetical protein
MSMFFKYLASVFLIFLVAGTASIEAAPPGFLEGHLKIIFGMAVGESGEMPRAEGAPQSYAKYPLIVLRQEDKKEIARVTVDQRGNYRVALPPGNYVLDIQDRVAKHIRAAPRPFTVVSNQTVQVDMVILSGPLASWDSSIAPFSIGRSAYN